MEKVMNFENFLNEAKKESAEDALLNVNKTLNNAKAVIDGEIDELDRIKKTFKKDVRFEIKRLKDLSKELEKTIKSIVSVSKNDNITYLDK